MKDSTAIILLLFVTLLLTVPFLNQALHLDDQEFISFAQIQLDHPLQFFLEDYNYMGFHFDVFRTTHPPLLSSILALVMYISGTQSELLFHGSYLIFPVVAAVSMFYLGKRFTRMPFFASLLLITSTGFLVMSHNLRGDLPGLALWLFVTTIFIFGVDRNNRNLIILTSVLIVLATMTSYQCLCLIPLLLLYLLLKRKISLLFLSPLVIAIIFFIAFTFYVRWSSGGFPNFSYSAVGFDFLPGLSDPHMKVLALLTFIGGSIIFPLSVVVIIARKCRELIIVASAITIITVGSVIILYTDRDLSTLEVALLIPMLAAGISMVYLTLKPLFLYVHSLLGHSPVADTDNVFLSVWVLGISFFNIMSMPSIAVRHLLPLFPPMILLFVKKSETILLEKPKTLTVFAASTVAVGLLISLPASIADYRLADSYRDTAKYFSERYMDTSTKVWYQGEFGFRYYMDKYGFSMLSPSSTAAAGDIIIRSETSCIVGSGTYDFFMKPPEERTEIIESIDIEDSFPVRIRTPWANTGFYSHRMGPVPVVASNLLVDHYSVYLCR